MQLPVVKKIASKYINTEFRGSILIELSFIYFIKVSQLRISHPTQVVPINIRISRLLVPEDRTLRLMRVAAP